MEIFGIDYILMALLFSLGGPIHSNFLRDIRDGEGRSWS